MNVNQKTSVRSRLISLLNASKELAEHNRFPQAQKIEDPSTLNGQCSQANAVDGNGEYCASILSIRLLHLA